MFKNLKMVIKQMAGFSSIIVLLLLVAFIGFTGISKINASLQSTIESAPYVDAAMRMKLSVARDMQMIMELLASQTKNELDDVWKEHEGFVRDFDTFAAAVLNGAETENGTIYASKDKKLRDIVIRADTFHNDQFQPRIKGIYDLSMKKVSGLQINEERLRQLDKEADEIGEKMLVMLGPVVDRAREVMTGAEKSALHATASANTGLIIAAVIGVVLSIVIGMFITRAITGPINKSVRFAERVSSGDLTQTLDIDQKDEIGVLAGALNAMVKNLGQMFRELSSSVDTLASSSTGLSTISQQMSGDAENTAGKSVTVATAAEEMSANMNSVAAASEQAATNVGIVATATEEMSATVNEIAKNSESARSITTNAVNQAKSTSSKVDELGRAADEISKVTEVITEISEQTNLLALNATIEAARAGEAGKGFAVVANEIKDLAGQTANATKEIKAKIESIQRSTSDTVSEISQISQVIDDVNEIVNTIATAVEEQAVTTKDIARNVTQASEGIQEVNENVNQSSTVAGEIAKDIVQVNQAASEITNNSAKVNLSAQSLSGLAEQLNQMVQQFTV